MISNNQELENCIKDSVADSTRPFHILVAEDNSINQKLILRLLEKMGYDADLAENGLEVLKAVEKKAYHLILMDIQMPKMDGMEAAKRIIEKYNHGKRPKIIAVTACVAQGDREKFLSIGMDDYISKPINIDRFKNCITYWSFPADNRPNHTVQ
ncbi:response regulator [Acidobacteriota bacterium]